MGQLVGSGRGSLLRGRARYPRTARNRSCSRQDPFEDGPQCRIRQRSPRLPDCSGDRQTCAGAGLPWPSWPGSSVEHWFGPVVGNPGFQSAVDKQTRRSTALVAVSGSEHDEVGVVRIRVPVDAFGAQGNQSRHFGFLIGGVVGIEVEVDSRVFLHGCRTEVEGPCDTGAVGRLQYRPVVLHLTIARDVAQCPTPVLCSPPHISGPHHDRSDARHPLILADNDGSTSPTTRRTLPDAALVCPAHALILTAADGTAHAAPDRTSHPTALGEGVVVRAGERVRMQCPTPRGNLGPRHRGWGGVRSDPWSAVP